MLPLFIRPDTHTDETLQLLGVSSKPNMMFRNSAFKKCKAAVDSGLDIDGFERYIDMLVEQLQGEYVVNMFGLGLGIGIGLGLGLMLGLGLGFG